MSLKRLLAIGTCITVATFAATPLLRAENKIPEQYKTGGFAIGCQAYTFNHFTVFEAIEKTAEAAARSSSSIPAKS